jgi:hypothetical protein
MHKALYCLIPGIQESAVAKIARFLDVQHTCDYNFLGRELRSEVSLYDWLPSTHNAYFGACDVGNEWPFKANTTLVSITQHVRLIQDVTKGALQI